MTGKAHGYTTRLMRATSLFIQPPHDRLVSQRRLGRDPHTELVTGRAGTGAGCTEDKFTVGIGPRSFGDLSKRAAMLRVASRAGHALRHQVTMPGRHGRRRPILEISLRMATHTASRTRATEWFVAVGTPGLIDVVSAQIARCPERSGTSHRPPADPDNKHKRHQSHHRHRTSWQRMVSHPSRDSCEEQRPRHMQHREHEKHQCHRRVDRLPHAERFLLGRHAMQLRVDIALG